MPDRDGVPLAELRAITKRFPSLVANDSIDLRVDHGEVLALLGENGAGKSTLTKILYGLSQPDSGEILIDGRPVVFRSPADAIAAGVGMVTQEFSLIGTMTVTENVMLSSVGLGYFDRRKAAAEVAAVAEKYSIEIDPTAPVERLSVGERQRIEILKALHQRCQLLILDEPTAVLVPQDVERLFDTIRTLTSTGIGVIFISHKLHEVTAIADRVTVLRRGCVVADVSAQGLDPPKIAALMIGPHEKVARPVQVTAPERHGNKVVELRGVTVNGPGRDVLSGIDLTVSAGEVLGVAGVSGNGQNELVSVLAGTLAVDAGEVIVDGRDVTPLGVADRTTAGLSRLGEDRRSAIVPEMSVEMTLVLERLDSFTRWGLIDRKAIRAHAEKMITRFDIRARPEDPIRSLSGGNIQKVLLARALDHHPVALVLSQPTRGLDIGACEFVYSQIAEIAEAGDGVLVVSEDLDELLRICDRIAVIVSGEIVGEVDAQLTSAQELGSLMIGHKVSAS